MPINFDFSVLCFNFTFFNNHIFHVFAYFAVFGKTVFYQNLQRAASNRRLFIFIIFHSTVEAHPNLNCNRPIIFNLCFLCLRLKY